MKKAYILAAITIFLWSSMATVSKLLLNTLDSFSVLCISALFAALFLLIINVATGNIKNLKNYKPKDIFTIILIGLPGTFFYYIFYYLGASDMPASQAFIINYLWPIMSVVFACILLKENMTVRKAVAIALSFVGVIIVTGGDLLKFDTKILMGAVLCMLAALSYGLFTALNKKFDYDKSLSVMLSFFATFLLTFVIVVAKGSPLTFSGVQYLGFLWQGITTMALGTTLWAIALSLGNTAKISNLAYITPFLSLVWTGLILKEQIKLSSLLGLAVIILGIFIQLKDKKESV